jgi:ppGpp synthetase/RelA/SpoT-type nucleotidyltranferase
LTTGDELELHFRKLQDPLVQLERTVENLVSQGISASGVKFSSIKTRRKDWESFREKVARKGYENPLSDCTDLLGVRIIVYLEADISRCESLIREYFSVDDKKSIDKRNPNNLKEFGYRSLHLICSLGEDRKALPEYRDYCDYRFEIQIRTALQDTWAEIEHAFNYKSEAALPSELERELFRTSALLETVDSALDAITAKAREYSGKITAGVAEATTGEITNLGLIALAQRLLDKHGLAEKFVELEQYKSNDNAARELRAFGLSTMKDVEDLVGNVDPELFQIYAKPKDIVAPIQLYRTAMAFTDPDRYFSQVDKKTLSGVGDRILRLIEERFPTSKARKIIEEKGIPISGQA